MSQQSKRTPVQQAGRNQEDLQDHQQFGISSKSGQGGQNQKDPEHSQPEQRDKKMHMGKYHQEGIWALPNSGLLGFAPIRSKARKLRGQGDSGGRPRGWAGGVGCVTDQIDECSIVAVQRYNR